MFSLMFVMSIFILFFSFVYLIFTLCNQEHKNKKWAIFKSLLIFVAAIILTLGMKPVLKNYPFNYTKYSEEINILSNNELIEKNLNDNFQSICEADYCSSFEGQTEFYDNIDLLKNIKKVSIIPVYYKNNYPGMEISSKSDPDSNLIYQTYDSKNRYIKKMLNNSPKQSLFKIEFKDKSNPVYMLVNFAIEDENGIFIIIKKDKFIINANKPNIYNIDYEKFNAVLKNSIITAINNKNRINHFDQKKNKTLWQEKEMQ